MSDPTAGADRLSTILLEPDCAPGLWASVDSGEMDHLVPELRGKPRGDSPQALRRGPPHDRVLVPQRDEQRLDHLLDAVGDVVVVVRLVRRRGRG